MEFKKLKGFKPLRNHGRKSVKITLFDCTKGGKIDLNSPDSRLK